MSEDYTQRCKEEVKKMDNQKREYMIYNNIYRKLEQLIPDLINLEAGDSRQSVNEPYMDLHLDILSKTGRGDLRIALAHNYIQNGDVMADPDMEIRVYPEMRQAEALTFQQDGGAQLFERVYEEKENGLTVINLKVKKRLNTFLNQWLKNLLDQGHSLQSEDNAAIVENKQYKLGQFKR